MIPSGKGTGGGRAAAIHATQGLTCDAFTHGPFGAPQMLAAVRAPTRVEK